MEINYGKCRKVMLNDRKVGYKPTFKDIKILVRNLPMCKVHGFGSYGIYDIWYLVVENPLWEDIGEDGLRSNITWAQAMQGPGNRFHNTIVSLPPTLA
jgi:hypothetical protein